MLLRNYDNIVAAFSLASYQDEQVGDTTTFGDGYLNVKALNGVLCSIKNSVSNGTMPLHYLNASYSAYSASWIVLGSGNTPVTYDDYKLENELTKTQIAVNSSSAIIGTPVYNEQNKTWTRTVSYDFQAKSDITVSEIGVEYTIFNQDSFLVYREVLDTPISLTTGQYLKVSITTTASANPNKPADVSASALVVE